MFVCLSVCFVFSSLVLCQLLTYFSSKTGTVISATVQWLEECTSYVLFVIRTIHISLASPMILWPFICDVMTTSMHALVLTHFLFHLWCRRCFYCLCGHSQGLNITAVYHFDGIVVFIFY